MKRRPALIAIAVAALLAIVVVVIATGSGTDEPPTTTRTPSPSGNTETTPARPDPSGLPAEFLECMSDRGYPVRSPAEIHSAPPAVLQECFGTLHDGIP